MEWIENNPVIFAAICTVVVAIIGLAAKFLKKSSNGKVNNAKTNTNVNNNKQELHLHLQAPPAEHNKIQNVTNCTSLKETIHILFVDDQRFNMINLLKSAGWQNVSYKKDITNIDCDEVVWAHIIFVDINGVGSKLFSNQGLGLGAAIKAKHPHKKVVIYSSESTGDRFDADIRKVDTCIAKNAEPIQFSNLIEELCNE